MSSKIEIRNLAERACGTPQDSPEYKRFITAIKPTLLLDLTAPVVERRPLIHITPEALAMIRGERKPQAGGLTFSESEPLGGWTVPLYAAPPELQAENSNLRLQCGGMETEISELQATIDRLTAENERLKAKPVCIYWDEKDHSCSDVERLKGGQGEPAIWLVRIPDELDNTDESPAEYEYADSKFTLNGLLQKPGATIEGRYFTSQPAPVSVVLPEREEGEPYWSGELDADFDQRLEWAEAKGFNRAIDKVKELNQ